GEAAPVRRPGLHDVLHAPIEARALGKGAAALPRGDAAGAAENAGVSGDAGVARRVDAAGGELVRRVPLAEEHLPPAALQADAGVARGPEAGARAVVEVHRALELEEGAQSLAQSLGAAEPEVGAVARDAVAAGEVRARRAGGFHRLEVGIQRAINLHVALRERRGR